MINKSLLEGEFPEVLNKQKPAVEQKSLKNRRKHLPSSFTSHCMEQNLRQDQLSLNILNIRLFYS